MPSSEPLSRRELRCFCSRSPLLAVYGIDISNRLFVHVKVYKQQRVYGEILCRGGEIALKCRECLRWHRITIRDSLPTLEEVGKPVELDPSNFVIQPI